MILIFGLIESKPRATDSSEPVGIEKTGHQRSRLIRNLTRAQGRRSQIPARHRSALVLKKPTLTESKPGGPRTGTRAAWISPVPTTRSESKFQGGIKYLTPDKKQQIGHSYSDVAAGRLRPRH